VSNFVDDKDGFFERDWISDFQTDVATLQDPCINSAVTNTFLLMVLKQFNCSQLEATMKVRSNPQRFVLNAVNGKLWTSHVL
jgi:hypothetical protein